MFKSSTSEQNPPLCLVTGATGLVGSHVVLQLLLQGSSVRATYRSAEQQKAVKEVFEYYGSGDVFSQIEWKKCNLLCDDEVAEALEGVGVVYHAASMVSFAAADSELMWRTNIEGTANICEAAQAAGAVLCHVSSIATIGHAAEGSVRNEQLPWQPQKEHSAYALSKFWQEAEVWRAIEAGLRAVIVAPGVVLGPCQKGRSSSAIAAAMQGFMPFYTTGKSGYVDARDLARVMIELTQKQLFGQKYIVVAENATVRTVQTLFAKCFGRNAPKIKATKVVLRIAAMFCAAGAIFSKKRPALTPQSVRTMCGSDTAPDYSSQKLHEAIDFSFRSLSESVENMADFFKKKN